MSVGIGLSRQQHPRRVRGAVQQEERVHPHAEVPHRGRQRRVGRQELPPVGGGAAAGGAGARPLLHLDGLLRAGQRHLRHDPVPGAVPGRLPLHRAALDRPAVRRRGGRPREPQCQSRESRSSASPPTPSFRTSIASSTSPACRARSRPARRRSSRTTSPGTSLSRRPTPRRGSSKGRSRRWRGAASAIRSASRTRRSSPTPSRAKTSTTTCRSSSATRSPSSTTSRTAT